MSRTSRDTFNNWKWKQLSITFFDKKVAKKCILKLPLNYHRGPSPENSFNDKTHTIVAYFQISVDQNITAMHEI